MKVETVKVAFLDESIQGSKFPMSVDLDSLDTRITKTVENLAGSEPGTGHDQFLDGPTVVFDLTFSNKAWVEAERYTFLNFISSQSTMHRISQMDIRNSCNEYVTENTIKEVERLKNNYLRTQTAEDYLILLYNVPSGFEITARMIANYRCLKTVYHQRKNHRLPEWRKFCRWCETLPHFKEWFVKEA